MDVSVGTPMMLPLMSKIRYLNVRWHRREIACHGQFVVEAEHNIGYNLIKRKKWSGALLPKMAVFGS